MILGWKIATGYKSAVMLENHRSVYTQYLLEKEDPVAVLLIEAVNKRIKYDFLFRKELPDFEHTRRFLEIAVEQYNNRPHSALFGLTPYEVFYGAKPDKNLFAVQKQQAKLLRIAENQALSCSNCLFSVENRGGNE